MQPKLQNYILEFLSPENDKHENDQENSLLHLIIRKKLKLGCNVVIWRTLK